MASKVYILGAGSSIGHSRKLFPAITTFFSRAKEFDLYSNKQFEALANYIRHEMGYNIYASRKGIDIEKVMTHIEIELERRSSPTLLRIRQELLELIKRVLIAAEKEIASRGGKGEYNLLKLSLQENDTIITFNWDLLLDNVLNRIPILKSYQIGKNVPEKYQSSQYYRFILDLSALVEKTWQGAFVRDPYYDWNPPGGYYLKVHGSIDWHYCSNESCRFFQKVFPVLLDEVYYCSECHEPLEHLLIPPVLNKGYHQYPLIRRIWNLAAKEISSVEELIIWGYSMPPTDFHSAWLLRQCRKNPPKRLLIINPSVKTKKNTVAAGFVRRFYEIFRGKIEKKKESLSLFENFSDYHDGVDILDKYHIGPAKKAYSTI
ncbi:MAG: hypothetical protein JRF30_07845 [Deltaproteobacteria bacterium]|nr:hypothetical protein [Deltaproteobacteria bacterium]